MKLDLSEIARTPGMQAVEEIDEPCPKEFELECISPVKGLVKLTNTGSLLLVEGEIGTHVKMECSRCLVDFACPITASMEEEFRIEKVGDAAQVLPMEEDASIELLSNNILDLQELIRQDMLLVLPIQPLCKPDCKGLCPTCGKNLNVRKCTCPAAEPELPFKVLAELLDEEKESGE
jgi:uncharacterized protein